MPRWPETWVSLCNLMLKLCGIPRSSAILGSDSPHKDNKKDNSLWVTLFIPRGRRPNPRMGAKSTSTSNHPSTRDPLVLCNLSTASRSDYSGRMGHRREVQRVFKKMTKTVEVVVNHCSTSLFRTKGLLSDIIIR